MIEYTDEIKKELCQFANMITPKNWNVSTEHHGFKGESGTLNIWLLFHDKGHYEDVWMLAESHSLIRFLDGAAFADIWLYPLNQNHEGFVVSYKGTIIHELAHIAVDRYVAFKEKVYRPGGAMIARMTEENMHGLTFQKALRLILVRAASVYGEQVLGSVIDETLSALDMYKVFPE
jgi:hypothetical protein